jgi:hypothetical protein
MKNNASIREGAAMNPLNRQLFFKDFRKQLEHSLTPEKAAAIWEDAGKEYSRILASDPEITGT